ncbi:MAG: DUF6268 family outer membrane beta-barrel protein, partial [Akkermansiaceae bacterium]
PTCANAPSAKFQISGTSEMDFDIMRGGFSMDRVLLLAPLGSALKINDCNTLSFGMRYEGTWLNSDTVIGDNDLHDLRVAATWMHCTSGSKWSFMAEVSPGVASDFAQIDGDDFSLNWLAGARYAVNDGFALIAGVGSDNTTGDDGVFPAIGFQWQASDDVYLSLVGATFTATYQSSEDWLWRFGVWAAGGIWNVEENNTSFDVNLMSYRAAIGVEHRLRDKVWLTLWAGTTFANELEIETAGGGRVFQSDADSGWFARVGLRVAAW